MSRNKTIEFMHRFTNEPYSVCRKKLNEYHWDLSAVLNSYDTETKLSWIDVSTALDILAKAFEDLANSTEHAVTALNDALTSFDWQRTMEDIKNLKEKMTYEQRTSS